MQPTARQLALLVYTVKKALAGYLLPPAKSVATAMPYHYIRNAHAVVCDLRDLAAAGLVTGAPGYGSNSTCRVKPTAEGIRIAAIESVAVAEEASKARVVNVTEIRWRCVDCNAATLNPSRPCAVCALLQNEQVVLWQPKEAVA